MTLTLLLLISSLSINIIIIINPLSIGITILFMALLVSTIFSYVITSWIAFLIFLIYIGGILVMFSYFVAITPNQTTNIVSIILIVLSTFLILTSISNILLIKITTLHNYITQSNIFFLKSNISILIFIAIILLFTIIIVVKLTCNTKGPLRPFK